jgi:hypothetical protein
LIFAVIAIVLVMGACGNPSSDGGSGDPSKLAFSVSGTFDTGKFELASDAQLGRSITADSYSLSGVLERGSEKIILTGSYDPVSGKYQASAASTSTRYTISGDSASPSEAIATISTQSGDDWPTNSYDITSGPVSIDDSDANPSEVGGMPSFAWGYWHNEGTYYISEVGNVHYKLSCLISQFMFDVSIEATYPDGTGHSQEQKIILAEYENSYDVIFAFAVYDIRVSANQGYYKDALQDFFNDKGLSITVTNWEDSDTTPLKIRVGFEPTTNPLKWPNHQFNQTVGLAYEEAKAALEEFTNSEWAFFNTWMKAHNHSTDVTAYEKWRITFTDGNTRFNMNNFGFTDGEGKFKSDGVTTVAAAKAYVVLNPESDEWLRLNFHR